VRRSNIGCSDTDPFRIEPEVGQSSKESSKPIPGNEAAHVLHEDESRCHVASEIAEGVDEVAVVVTSSLLACA
jgi:hypothetical protein